MAAFAEQRNERAQAMTHRDEVEHTASRVGDIEQEIARVRAELEPLPAERAT